MDKVNKDKYSAVWTSHSSINDFLKCPRAYYLKHVYRDPKTNHKIKITSPPLSLGKAVHDVIESLSILPLDKRFDTPLIEKLEEFWSKVSGKKGGFFGDNVEQEYKARAKEMLVNITKNPGPIKKLAVKIDTDLPYFWLSEEDNIILCGKIDWMEYLAQEDAVHIIDFKTGRSTESADSLQLPIYNLIANNCQSRLVKKVSYWYLAKDTLPKEQKLPDLDGVHKRILKIARDIKLARQLNRFKCPDQGCRSCKPYEAVVKGKAELVGVGEYGSDIYILSSSSQDLKQNEKIL